MYTRQETSAIRKKFWTTFGQYMKPVPSADGSTMNWLNYKTGIKHIYFRMDAGNHFISVAIELQHPDAELRQLFYEQLLSLRKVLETFTGEAWDWQPRFINEEGRELSRVVSIREGVSIFQEADWPEMISFLKPRMIALDAFWEMAKESMG